MMFDEGCASKAIVRVVTPDGATLGTGFFVDGSGHVLTCLHVVSQGAVRICDSDGNVHDTILRDDNTDRIRDLALLETNVVPPAVLPIADDRSVPNRVWTAGFVHADAPGIRHAIPSLGAITGHTFVDHNEFELRDALVLKEIEVGPGLSGAPVVALPEGVVIGVVNADFRNFGFAISPFSAVAPGIRAALSTNDRDMSRYGRYLNFSGVRALACMQTSAALRRLISNRQYLPDQYIDRTSVNSLFADFLNSGRKILPLIGRSGTGKTTLLAHLLEAERVEPVVFVPAYRIDFSTSLQQALLAVLVEESSENGHVVASVQGLEQALRSAGRELVFILDGLNEAPVSLMSVLRPWFERSSEWLRKVPVRLIVSCRTDFWGMIKDDLPPELVFVRDRGESAAPPYVNVTWFNEDEVEAAVNAYHLPPEARHLDALRHPLLVRLYWTLGMGAAAGRVDAYTLLGRFVDDISHAVARRLDGVSVSVVRAKLVELAGLLDSSLTIDAGQLAEMLSSDPRLRDVLFRENVMVDAGSTAVRFSFDELAEFLIGSTRTLPPARDEVAWWPLVTNRSALSSLRYAIVRLEREGRHREVRDVLVRMTAALYAPDEETLILEIMFPEILTSLENPGRHFDLIIEVIRKAIQHTRGVAPLRNASTYGVHPFKPLAHTLPLDRQQRLRLIRELFPGEHDYWWKRKTWRREGPHGLRRTDTLAAALAEVIRQDPATTFYELAQWLDDRTPLASDSAFREADIGDVAQCFLFWFRDEAFDVVCDLAAERTAEHSSGASQLLVLLVESDASRLLDPVERWSKRPLLQEVSVNVANRLANRRDIDQPHLSRILEGILAEKVTRNIRTLATAAMIQVTPAPDDHVARLIRAFLADDPVAVPTALPLGDQRYTAEIRDAFAQYLQHGRDRDRKNEILHSLDFLAKMATSSEQVSIADVVVNFEVTKDHAAAFGVLIESLLQFLPAPSPAFTRIVDVAARVLQDGFEETRRPVVYAATAAYLEPEKRADQKRLIKTIVVAGDPETRKQLRDELVSQPNLFEEAIEWVLELTASIDGTQFSKPLLWRAYSNEAFGRKLGSWAAKQPESSLSGFVLNLRRAVIAGSDLKAALRDFLPKGLR